MQGGEQGLTAVSHLHSPIKFLYLRHETEQSDKSQSGGKWNNIQTGLNGEGQTGFNGTVWFGLTRRRRRHSDTIFVRSTENTQRQRTSCYPEVCFWAGCSFELWRVWLQIGPEVQSLEWTAGGVAAGRKQQLLSTR